MNLPSFLTKGFSFNIGGLTIAPAYWHAIAVVFLVFLLVLMMAQVRRHFLDWSIKGALFGVFFGFLLALILEGFLIIGGKTVVTELLGWKNAPKPISVALERGREQLIDVLGVTDEIPTSNASVGTTYEKSLQSFQSLAPDDAKRVKALICQ